MQHIKKMFAALLVMVLIFTIIPYNAYAEESKEDSSAMQTTEETIRYTVLVLDASTSMRGTPERVQREAAIKFCNALSEAQGTNYVAIVRLTSSSERMCDFTTDIDTLTSYINRVSAVSGTNINQALEEAEELLLGVEQENAIKNIVLCSDGVPEKGSFLSEGKYTSADNSNYYGYGNACIATTDRLKEASYNIYTLGFFHSLSGQNLTFGRQLMKDMASSDSQYYEVVNAEDLEFTFGEIAEDVVSKDNDPIVIVPGIMGSRLFTEPSYSDDTRAWDPVVDVTGVTQLNERLDIDNSLYVRPCENQQNYNESDSSGYEREYGAQGTYKTIVDRLCSEFPDRAVYFFSYDWRKSNSESADKLNDAIENIINETGAEKVDIVCHSMGGLVASSYFSSYGDENLDKIITCGTPYEGAPKLINAVMNWDVLGEGIALNKNNLYDLALGLFGSMRKDLKASFDGVTELTPTENYVSKIPMQQDSWVPFNGFDYNLSYLEYVDYCNNIFGKQNYSDARDFQYSIQQEGYNCLLSYDNSFFVIGTNHKTITAVKFQFIGNDIDQRLYESDLNYDTEGDGTVPYLSASIMEQIENLNTDRWETFNADHGEVVKNDDCITWITDVLKNGSSEVVGDTPEATPYVVVRIACPVDVTVTDNGETLSSDIDQISDVSSFGRLDILGENDEIKMLCLDADKDFTLSLNGTDSGTMDYTIRFYDAENNLLDERTFDDVPVTENTTITTKTSQTDNTVLNIDVNGDGSNDETWTASKNEWVAEPDAGRVPLTGVSLKFDRNTIRVGETANAEVVKEPENSNDNIAATYSSSNENIASIDSDGTIYAVAPGTATITAEVNDGLFSVSAEIIITDEQAEGMQPSDQETQMPDQNAQTPNQNTQSGDKESQELNDSEVSESVDTGDDSQLFLYVGLFVTAAFMITIIMILRKKDGKM